MEMIGMQRKDKSQAIHHSLLAIRGSHDHKEIVAIAAAAKPSDSNGGAEKHCVA
jgi:hypothetical protein